MIDFQMYFEWHLLTGQENQEQNSQSAMAEKQKKKASSAENNAIREFTLELYFGPH